MIKLNFKPIDKPLEYLVDYYYYYYLPFMIRLKENTMAASMFIDFFSENSGVFIQSAFDSWSKTLSRMDLVSLNNEKIKKLEDGEFNRLELSDEFYSCSLEIEIGDDLEHHRLGMMTAFMNETAMLITIGESRGPIKYYRISESIYLGTDSDSSCCAILLLDLSEADLREIKLL
ncbi:hypothetical protein PPO43_01560 [Saprospira sp. CCB-QB6]|uniref:hypothetical protein n=1 Tax=Saprospira sp. CCB-QB6 TaxID=3023936 RepID=UPI002349CFD3|nr:hypothetical protein [Saprospira sp. CCB-QB6]WCL81783.1 hypothetical protein PPO43_01560 [Saprospira sp. CCB-QB6]